MDKESELFLKANALLSRQRASTSEDYPLLTERVILNTPAHFVESTSVLGDDIHGSSASSHKEIDGLEDRIFERLLPVTQALVAEAVSVSFKRHLISVLEKSIGSMGDDLAELAAIELKDRLRAIVRMALQSELSEIQSRTLEK